MGQIEEYKVFHDRGRARYEGNKLVNAPRGYQQARVHLIYDVKHDGRHKARLVLDGNLTEVPVESVYSSVVSLKSLRLVSFLSALNDLELWGADVGNAYLEAETKEKLFIVAGEEFGAELHGHILIVHKALYGSRSGGRCWWERWADVLKAEGFQLSKGANDVWMRPAPDKSLR